MTSRHRRWALLIATGAGTISVFAFVVLPAVLVSTITACSNGPTVPAGNGSWLATAYGPPWGGIQGNGVTATGINLTAGPPMLEVAVDPSVIPLRSFVHVEPNPFDTPGAFYAGDTGGAIVGQHVDIYDWRGRAEQDAWGARQVTVTPAADPGAGNALEQVQAPALVPPANQCASAGGYQNPFAHATAIVPERIDMGVDYTASGQIDALGRRDRHLLAGRGRRLGTVRLLGGPRWRGGVPTRRWPRPGPLRVRDRGDHPGGSSGPAGLGRGAGGDVHGLHRDRLGIGHRRSAHGRRTRPSV